MGGLIIISDDTDWSVGNIAFDWVIDLLKIEASKTNNHSMLGLLKNVEAQYPFRGMELSPGKVPDDVYRQIAVAVTAIAANPVIPKDQSFNDYLADLKTMMQQDARVSDLFPEMLKSEKIKRERWRK